MRGYILKHQVSDENESFEVIIGVAPESKDQDRTRAYLFIEKNEVLSVVDQNYDEECFDFLLRFAVLVDETSKKYNEKRRQKCGDIL